MLELKNITKTFGSVTANNDVSIKIEKGTIHAIVGENGAGKSTIMRIAYGFYNADSGEILIDSKPVNIRTPQDAINLGIGMVHQHFMLVDTMSVGENIILGAEGGNPASIDWKKANADILALSNELRLGVNPKALIEDLSVGAQQRVELLKALYRKAELLILDEPTAVLTPQEVEDFFNILRRMREQGKTIVIITHKLEEVLAISDDVTVMRDGKVVGNVKTADTNAKELARMIVGRDVLLRIAGDDHVRHRGGVLGLWLVGGIERSEDTVAVAGADGVEQAPRGTFWGRKIRLRRRETHRKNGERTGKSDDPRGRAQASQTFSPLTQGTPIGAKLRLSLPGLTRQSILLRKDFLQRRWMRGSSPRMTSRVSLSTYRLWGTSLLTR